MVAEKGFAAEMALILQQLAGTLRTVFRFYGVQRLRADTLKTNSVQIRRLIYMLYIHIHTYTHN